VLSAGARNLRPEQSPSTSDEPRSRTHRWFSALFASYALEGVGYIIAGTFLVAAIDQDSPGWIGSGAWVIVGLAAVPSAVLWARLGRRWSHPDLLLVALVVQAVGIAAEAAARTGFTDQSHLHPHFRRSLGFTPGQYKRLITAAGLPAHQR
jgi:AraC-like DNA-binding protein